MEIPDKQDLLISSLKSFYNEDCNKKIIIPIVKQETKISLRLLDWLVTNYSKQNNVTYKIGDKNFSLWLDYKNQLKAYSKIRFDPFCRRKRIFYDCETNQAIPLEKEDYKKYEDNPKGFITTVGQLNFFRWALTHRVVDYAFENIQEIESDMLKYSDSRKLNTNKRRNRKKSRISSTVLKHNVKVVVQFP